MARQVAVAIGVANVPGLPLLNGVAPGTQAFADWATGQGFEVAVHEDSAAPVTYAAVAKTVKDAVDAGDVERLFVFFGGHGMEKGQGEDIWLLSDPQNDPTAAINVAVTTHLARWCGIPHVAIFADACRTPFSKDLDHLDGLPLFPKTKVPNVRVQLDTYFATVSGDPAFEPTDPATLYGLFTECLLTAINGQARESVTPTPGGKQPYAVLADPLGDYLYREVRLRSGDRFKVTQTPDCIPGSTWKPNVIAWVPAAPAPFAPAPSPPGPPPPAPSRPMPRASARSRGWDLLRLPQILRRAERPATPPPAPQPAPRGADDSDRREAAAAIAEGITARPGRTHFETGIGASVVGGKIVSAFFGRERMNAFAEDGAEHVRLYSSTPEPLFLEVGQPEGNIWLGGLALPGYVTTFTVGQNGAEHVAFLSIRDGDSSRGEADVERDGRDLAWAATLFRMGDRRFTDSPEARRLIKQGNPTMVVLAAYAYARLGRDDDVRDLAERCLALRGWLPYDVAMLAGIEERERTVTRFPLMTRGWALADDIDLTERAYGEARRQLAAAPWTTFRTLDEKTQLELRRRR